MGERLGNPSEKPLDKLCFLSLRFFTNKKNENNLLPWRRCGAVVIASAGGTDDPGSNPARG
jgi:hypothetical protein